MLSTFTSLRQLNYPCLRDLCQTRVKSDYGEVQEKEM